MEVIKAIGRFIGILLSVAPEIAPKIREIVGRFSSESGIPADEIIREIPADRHKEIDAEMDRKLDEAYKK